MRSLHKARPLYALTQHLGAFPHETLNFSPTEPQVLPPSSNRPPEPRPSVDRSTHVHLDCLPFKPRLPMGCNVAARYNGASLSLCATQTVQIPVGPGINAEVEAVDIDATGRGSLRGWLNLWGVPVVALALLPTSWWKGADTSHSIMQDIWQSLAPQSACVPPQRFFLAAEATENGLDLRLRGAWHGGQAQVVQDLRLKPSGCADPGAGSLRFEGSLIELSRFVDTQLLPLMGEHPIAHPPATDLSNPVHATACWAPEGEGQALRMDICAARWNLHGNFMQNGSTTRFSMVFAGHPASFGAAARQLQLPRMCQIDDLAGWVRTGSTLARAWSLSPGAWRHARAEGRAVGTYQPDCGVHATGELRYRHGPWLDVLTGYLEPRSAASAEHPAHVPPTEVEATVRALAHVARFASGRHGQWDSDTLRACGANLPDTDGTVTLRRYNTTNADFVFPDVLRSVLALWTDPRMGHKKRNFP